MAIFYLYWVVSLFHAKNSCFGHVLLLNQLHVLSRFSKHDAFTAYTAASQRAFSTYGTWDQQQTRKSRMQKVLFCENARRRSQPLHERSSNMTFARFEKKTSLDIPRWSKSRSSQENRHYREFEGSRLPRKWNWWSITAWQNMKLVKEQNVTKTWIFGMTKWDNPVYEYVWR